MTLRQRVDRLKAQWAPPPAVPTLPPMSPLDLWQRALGCTPDPWQAQVLSSDDPRICLCCARQSGKSSVVAVKALSIALTEPDSLILLLSRSLRQSSELSRKVFSAYEAVGRSHVPPQARTSLVLELANGSRLITLPGGDPESLRGFSSPRAVILDESARIPDSLWISVRPMLAVAPRATMILLSTPFGKRGFYWRVWSESPGWLKIRVPADQCPRLRPTFLREELIELGERWFAQEYLLAFVEAEGQVFSDASIDAAFHDGLPPLWDEPSPDNGLLVALPNLFEGQL